MRLYIAICPVVIIGIDIVVEYRKKSNFYNELKNNLEKLDTKYLISEIINTPDFIEGKILKNTIQETGKSMLENVNSYKQLQEDYKEYIELWIHEIKIPIATSKLIIENNKNEIQVENTSIITNIRHKESIKKSKECVYKALEAIKNGMTIDIVAIYLKEAIESLNAITGENVTEDIINDIFSKFCLGK